MIRFRPAERHRPLPLRHWCVPVTIGLFEGHCLVDPSVEEERAIDAVVTVAVRYPQRDICLLQQVHSFIKILLHWVADAAHLYLQREPVIDRDTLRSSCSARLVQQQQRLLEAIQHHCQL